MINTYLLCGGPSSEHDIALRSALNISKNLNKEKYKLKLVYVDKKGRFSNAFDFIDTDDEFDLVKECKENILESISDFLLELKDKDKENTIIIPCIHGTYGEDGTIQGFLDAIDIAYIGNGLLSSSVCMDKVTANDIFEKNKLKQARYLYAKEDSFDEDFAKKCQEYIKFPMIVKPSANGSSVGVNKAENIDDLLKFGKESLKYDEKILVEEAIIGQEVEIAVIGDNEIIASKPGAYTTNHTFLDYDAKYFDKSTVENLPYEMDEKLEKDLLEFAKECYKACGCQGFARVDVFLKDNEFYINEINTFPGFTPTSFFARLCKISFDLEFTEILDMLIDEGFKSYQKRRFK
ncbi:MAG: D-alanine--D-alanine ligase family protein [Anaerococcus hydrogenalis]|uniref:D-alanine--D-alanine ligase family protein n=1 Tax=Anaerococcus hydrogenalis TaxID=33029 RepID=UPI0029000B10|nr:D-alanine--D-alanine ligase family protein [Anaerococcus hydrogenalis]MDU3198919.1 D-alanine--D-alanine ligase family protein [Anaerococcus hydrogenalis]MDU3687740.1 D-alanine--D-alanine ligase family protein [Anaerococcus hydrogenalis]